MELPLETRIFAYKNEDDIYCSNEIVRFEPDQLEGRDMQICAPLIGCKIADNDELIINIPNRLEFISNLLKEESAEDQLKIIAWAQHKL